MATIAQIAAGTDLIHYDTQDYITSGFYLATAFVGFVAGCLVLVSSFRHTPSPAALLSLSLCWADLIVSFTSVVYGIKDLAQGSFSTGPIGCVINAFLTLFGCYMSVLSVLSITLERYLAIMHNWQMTKKHAIRLMLGIHVFSVIVTGFPIATNTYHELYAMMPAKQICVFAWWVDDPLNITVSIVSDTILIMCVSCMIFAYSRIVLTYFATKQQMHMISMQFHDMANDDILMQQEQEEKKVRSLEKKKAMSEAEKKLLRKAMIITGLFILCWIPYMSKIFVETVYQAPVSRNWDAFFSVLGVANSTCNPILMYIFDARVKRNIHELFGYIQPSSDSKISNPSKHAASNQSHPHYP